MTIRSRVAPATTDAEHSSAQSSCHYHIAAPSLLFTSSDSMDQKIRHRMAPPKKEIRIAFNEYSSHQEGKKDQEKEAPANVSGGPASHYLEQSYGRSLGSATEDG